MAKFDHFPANKTEQKQPVYCIVPSQEGNSGRLFSPGFITVVLLAFFSLAHWGWRAFLSIRKPVGSSFYPHVIVVFTFASLAAISIGIFYHN